MLHFPDAETEVQSLAEPMGVPSLSPSSHRHRFCPGQHLPCNHINRSALMGPPGAALAADSREGASPAGLSEELAVGSSPTRHSQLSRRPRPLCPLYK